MNLKELSEKLNIMYEKYGDVEVAIDFKTNTNEDQYYSFEKNGIPVSFMDTEPTTKDCIIMPEDTFDNLFIEEVLDVQELYWDREQTKVAGIMLTNYKDEEGEDNEQTRYSTT